MKAQKEIKIISFALFFNERGNTMKQILALILSVTMIFALTGCGSDDGRTGRERTGACCSSRNRPQQMMP